MFKNSFLLLVFTDVYDVCKVATSLKQEKCLHVEVIYTNTIPGKILGGMLSIARLGFIVTIF